MGQEFYPEYEENQYYDKEYDPYKNNNDNNAPIVNVEKKLFVCNNATDNSSNFLCTFANPEEFPFLPATIDSDEYIPCNDEICPGIDESDFGVQIFKDVATIRELSPEGTSVNLDKFHYTVTERSITDVLGDGFCSAVGFSHNTFFTKLTDDNLFRYDMCVNYVGDCEGTIYPGEVKTCTVENYIFLGESLPIPTDGNAAGGTQSLSLSQQSNNQVMQSQPNFLKDIISDRTE